MKKNGLKMICALLAVGCMATLAAAVNQVESASASEIEITNPIIVSGEDVNYSVRAVSVRIVDDEYGAGVRFKVAMDKEVFEENLMEDPDGDGVKTMKANITTGTLLIPEYTLAGNELTIATAEKNETTTDIWYENDFGQMETCVYVYDIPEKNYASNIVVRGYVQIGDEIIYTQAGRASMAYAAYAGQNGEGLTDEQKQSLKDTYLTYELNYFNGSTQIGETQTIYYGEKIDRPADVEVAVGYTFNGWFNKAGTQSWDFDNYKVSGPMSLYANITANTNTPYKVEAYLEQDNGAFVATEDTTFDFVGTTDANVTVEELNLTVPTGYTFDATNENNVLAGTIAGDGSLVLKVYCKLVKSTVNYYVDGAISATETVKYGGVVSGVSDPEKQDAIFAGWYTSADAAANLDDAKLFNAETKVTGDLNLYAGFDVASFLMKKPLLDQYVQYSNVAIPDGQYSFKNDNVQATVVVTDPDGAVVEVEDGSIQLKKLGSYIVSYTAQKNGMSLSKTAEIESVANVAYMSGDIAGTAASGTYYLSSNIAAGDTATINHIIDWSDKTSYQGLALYQTIYDAMTIAQYKTSDITIRLTNADNAAQYIEFVPEFYNGGSLANQLVVNINLYGLTFADGKTTARHWMAAYAGSDNSPATKGDFMWISTNGLYHWNVGGSTHTQLPITNMFTKGVMSVTSNSGMALTWSYFGGSTRYWTANTYNVTYVSEGEIINAESVFNGGVAKATVVPSSGDKAFIGWFASAADAASGNASLAVDMNAGITANKTLYAGFATVELQLAKPLLGQYAQNSTISASGNLTYLNDSVAAVLSVKAPDGTDVVVTDNSFVASQLGVYTLNYTATINGKDYVKTCTINSVAAVSYASGTDAGTTTQKNASNGLLTTTIAAGDTLTVNHVMDWSDKTAYQGLVLYAANFNQMTSAEYKTKDITFRLTNAEDASQYIEFVIEFFNDANNVNHIVVNTKLYGGLTFADGTTTMRQWMGRYAGSDNSNPSRDDFMWISTNGLYHWHVGSNGNHVQMPITDMFTTGVLTVTSESGIEVEFNYLGGSVRGW